MFPCAFSCLRYVLALTFLQGTSSLDVYATHFSFVQVFKRAESGKGSGRK